MVLRQFALIEQSLFASQAYLNEFGNIKSPDELSDHRILSLSEEHLDQQFILHGPDNQLKKVKVSPTIMGTNIYMLAQLASQNCGIAFAT